MFPLFAELFSKRKNRCKNMGKYFVIMILSPIFALNIEY